MLCPSQPVRLGSIATEMACSCDVRFPLESDRLADLLGSCVDLVTVTKIARSFFVCSQELITSDCHPRLEWSSGQGQGDCFPCEGDLICQPTSSIAKLRQL